MRAAHMAAIVFHFGAAWFQQTGHVLFANLLTLAKIFVFVIAVFVTQTNILFPGCRS